MQQLYIPVPADQVARFNLQRQLCAALREAGFYLWDMHVRQEQDGTVSALLPRVVFTDRPGDPDNSYRPGSSKGRRAAYRSVARRMHVRGLYPVECRP